MSLTHISQSYKKGVGALLLQAGFSLVDFFKNNRCIMPSKSKRIA